MKPSRRDHLIFWIAITTSATLSIVILAILVHALGWVAINVLGAATVAFWILSVVNDAISNHRARRRSPRGNRESL